MLRISTRHRGFTLIELMIVVAIIGILAAIAIPVVSGYVKRSKTTEAMTLLQGIREKQENYFVDFKRYTGTIDWTPRSCPPPAGQGGSTVAWTAADLAKWSDIGFVPDGPTYYSYRIETSYNNGAFTGPPGYNPPGNPTFTATRRPWYIVMACGDLDNDGAPSVFYLTSTNKTVVKAKGLNGAIDSDDEVF